MDFNVGGGTMTRLILFAGFILLFLAAALGLKACQDGALPLGHRAPPPADLSSIVSLKNGSVMTAPQGTVGRDLLDWLASSDRTERYFELGGREFDGRSVEPTIESKVRVKRLTEMLRSNPDVAVSVIGFTAATADPAADLNLSRERAVWLVRALRDGGISSSRLSAEGRGGTDAIASNATPAGRARNERVALLLRSKR